LLRESTWSSNDSLFSHIATCLCTTWGNMNPRELLLDFIVSCFIKMQNVLTFYYRLTRADLENGLSTQPANSGVHGLYLRAPVHVTRQHGLWIRVVCTELKVCSKHMNWTDLLQVHTAHSLYTCISVATWFAAAKLVRLVLTAQPVMSTSIPVPLLTLEFASSGSVQFVAA